MVINIKDQYIKDGKIQFSENACASFNHDFFIKVDTIIIVQIHMYT